MSDLDELYREIEAVVEELEAFIRGGSYPNYKMPFMLMNDARILRNGVLPRLRALLPQPESLEDCVERVLRTLDAGHTLHADSIYHNELRAALARRRGEG